MTKIFFALLFLLCSYEPAYLQEDLHVDVKSFDIVPGVGLQTKTVRFDYNRVGNEEETQFVLDHVNVRYTVAASMEIEIDFQFTRNGTLQNFVKSVKGYDCGRETMNYDKGALTDRSFEPYEEEDCAGETREHAVAKNKESLDSHDLERAAFEVEEAGKYRDLFAELCKSLLKE